jgi:flagellar hook-basal body complex protein FliE
MNTPNYLPVSFRLQNPMPGMGSLMGRIEKMATAQPSGPSFQQVMMNTLQSVNETTQKPDMLLKEAMTTGGVDIHDVMVANAKAELAVSLTAQFSTKIIQAYDRILQIQV